MGPAFAWPLLLRAALSPGPTGPGERPSTDSPGRSRNGGPIRARAGDLGQVEGAAGDVVVEGELAQEAIVILGAIG